jgi:hypothetical protein
VGTYFSGLRDAPSIHRYFPLLAPRRLFFQEYNVADSFNLSREVVALSMSLFDRFMATRICLRLVSIATLHISIKVSESSCIMLSTLVAWFGKGNVSEAQITTMELLILTNVRSLVNPPTAITVVMHLVLLLPDRIFPVIFIDPLLIQTYFIGKRSSITGMDAVIHLIDTFELHF